MKTAPGLPTQKSRRDDFDGTFLHFENTKSLYNNHLEGTYTLDSDSADSIRVGSTVCSAGESNNRPTSGGNNSKHISKYITAVAARRGEQVPADDAKKTSGRRAEAAPLVTDSKKLPPVDRRAYIKSGNRDVTSVDYRDVGVSVVRPACSKANNNTETKFESLQRQRVS